MRRVREVLEGFLHTVRDAVSSYVRDYYSRVRNYFNASDTGGMVHDWFEKLKESAAQMPPYRILVVVYSPVRRACSGVASAAGKVADFITGKKPYDMSKLPEYLMDLYEDIPGEKPPVYVVNWFGEWLNRAVKVLGLYNGRAIYVRKGLGDNEKEQVLAHEMMHAYQGSEGMLGWRNLLRYGMRKYRAFVEGMANALAILYLKAHGADTSLLEASYQRETQTFMNRVMPALERYGHDLGTPDGIRDAVNYISRNLETFFHLFSEHYSSQAEQRAAYSTPSYAPAYA